MKSLYLQFRKLDNESWRYSFDTYYKNLAQVLGKRMAANPTLLDIVQFKSTTVEKALDEQGWNDKEVRDILGEPFRMRNYKLAMTLFGTAGGLLWGVHFGSHFGGAYVAGGCGFLGGFLGRLLGKNCWVYRQGDKEEMERKAKYVDEMISDMRGRTLPN